MGADNGDAGILRELAKRYADLAAKPVQERRRELWAAHFALKRTAVPVLATYGMWNVWCREAFGDSAMECQDSFLREHERSLRLRIFQDEVGDDSILEPWLTVRAVMRANGGSWVSPWGVQMQRKRTGDHGGSYVWESPIQQWSDMAKLTAPPHEIDEAETARRAGRMHDAIGDILPICIDRSPVLSGFMADISTTLAALRGLEQIMLDMYEAPAELHRLLAFMRDGVLANQQQAEDAGHYTLATQHNQAMTYAEELERPERDSGPRKRKALWGFLAAQEFTLISPAFHEEFLLRYQMPVAENFGLVHYGCCEDLTRKIDMLRQVKNLRSIAVTPRADVRKCAEQIGGDYAFSWRPNPADMVSCGWDEGRIRRILREGLPACRANGCLPHVHLKDIETVEGDTSRLARWVKIVREEAAA
jgi:hypothetical protein